MNAAAERKYRMLRVGTGDYILPSNDRKTIWRIARYEDGPSHGLVGMARDRDFWGAWKWTSTSPPDPEWDDRWALMADMYDTRQQAIDFALTHRGEL